MAEPDSMRQDNHGGTNFQNNISGGQVNQAQTINIYGSAPLPSGEANPFGVPYQRNGFFTGREQVLADLHGQLMAGGSTAITQIQAISGLGGIGKTQTAVEYAYRHFRETYSHMFWVKADTEVNLSSDFAQLAVQLALPAAQGKEEEKLAAVQAWLANHDGWLLVFDNADKPEWLVPLMPTNPRGKVLLTSRATIFDDVGIRSPLPLDVLSLEESIELIFERTGRERSEAELAAAAELNKELDGLPLALEQASAFMVRKRVGLTPYLKAYRKAGLAQLEKGKARVGNYPSSVVKTWALNMAAVAAEAPAAAELLTFSAFLAPDGIPYRILTLGREKLGDLLQEALQGEDEDEQRLALSELLEPLSQYSLARWEPEREVYSVHRLVQAVARDGVDLAEQVGWVERAIEATAVVYPGQEFTHWPICGRLLPHWLSLVKQTQQHQIGSVALIALLNQASSYTQSKGLYAIAEQMSLTAVKICQEKYEGSPLQTVTSLNNLAALYTSMGQYQKASSLYLQALKSFGTESQNNRLDIAHLLNNLAALKDLQGAYRKSEILYLQALKIRKANLTEYDLHIGESLSNLARNYHNQARYSEAESLYLQAVEIKKTALGENEPSIATSLDNLAMLYESQERYSDAEKLSLQALKIRRISLGNDHIETAQSFNSLGIIYYAQQRYSKSEVFYKQALTIRKAVIGNRHPDVAESLNNLAAVYSRQNRFKESEAAMVEVVKIFEKQLGEKHPKTLISKRNLASLKQKPNKK